jgi:hypothetical protein
MRLFVFMFQKMIMPLHPVVMRSCAQCCEINQCSIVKKGQTKARISNAIREGFEVELILQYCQNDARYSEEN